MLGKSYDTDTVDLKDLDWHSDKGIEHDASLFRTYPLLSPHLLSSLNPLQ